MGEALALILSAVGNAQKNLTQPNLPYIVSKCPT